MARGNALSATLPLPIVTAIAACLVGFALGMASSVFVKAEQEFFLQAGRYPITSLAPAAAKAELSVIELKGNLYQQGDAEATLSNTNGHTCDVTLHCNEWYQVTVNGYGCDDCDDCRDFETSSIIRSLYMVVHPLGFVSNSPGPMHGPLSYTRESP